MTIRILVTGSREWADRETLERELLKAFNHYSRGEHHVVFVHGDCRTGADRMCREWVEKQQAAGNKLISHEAHPYRSELGKRGGPIRNGEMVALGPYELCCAFWDGQRERSGTLDCFAQAVAAGITTRITPRKRP